MFHHGGGAFTAAAAAANASTARSSILMKQHAFRRTISGCGIREKSVFPRSGSWHPPRGGFGCLGLFAAGGNPHRLFRWRNSLQSPAAYESGGVSPVSQSTSPDGDLALRGGLLRLLSDDQRALLEEQRELVRMARALASEIGNVEVHNCSGKVFNVICQNESQEQEDESTFTIVVAGEFNAGKSTVINALLGKKLLETGALPTTDVVTILASSGTSTLSTPLDTAAISEFATSHHNIGEHGGVTLHRITNIPLLEDLTLVDTPGTNAVIADHTARTAQLLPEADLILFVTSADRPFPESERQLLQSIQCYRKNIIIVINKMDVLEASGGNYGQQEKDRIVDFVTEHASELLGARPIVLPISARDAMSAKLMHGKQSDESGIWVRSNFASLESFLRDSLTTETKIKSKLSNPIGVAEGMLGDCVAVLQEQQIELKTDVSTLNLLQSQMDGWTNDIEQHVGNIQKEIHDIFVAEGKQCNAVVHDMGYFDQWNWAVFDGTKFDNKWKSAVERPAADSPHLETALLGLVDEISDLIATRARAQGQAVIEYLGKRPAIKSNSLIGSVTAASRFEDTRKELSEKMKRAVHHVLRDVNSSDEQLAVVKYFRGTILLSGAIHLGAFTTSIATIMQILDVPVGVASSVTLASLGAYIVPYRNDKIAKRHECTWVDRGQKMETALASICSKEMQMIKTRILDGVSPYTRYVRTEQDRVQQLADDCKNVLSWAHRLRRQVNKLCGGAS